MYAVVGCRQYEFQCSNRRCVDERVKCDGVNDCGDNSDETQCGKQAVHFSNDIFFKY